MLQWEKAIKVKCKFERLEDEAQFSFFPTVRPLFLYFYFLRILFLIKLTFMLLIAFKRCSDLQRKTMNTFPDKRGKGVYNFHLHARETDEKL